MKSDAHPVPQTTIFSGYIDEREYCRQRGISLRTAQRARRLREAPPHIVIGAKVYYRVDAVRAWLIENERAPKRRPHSASVGGPNANS